MRGAAKWLAVAACTAAALGGATACGGDRESSAPEGVPELDLQIGREVASGYQELREVIDGDLDGGAILDRYSEIGERRRQFARPHREAGTVTCIKQANDAWWLVVGGFGLGDMTAADPNGRANIMLEAADNIPLVHQALESCPADLQAAIGWGE